MLKRYSPLKRSGKPLARRKRPKRIKPERAAERAQYRKRKEAFISSHPFDQIWIATRGLSEGEVIAADGWALVFGVQRRAPRSNQIHHRNKAIGARLLDERWWMATSYFSHEGVEAKKDWARGEGYLLPIQADAEGRWGDGNQALETPALMKSKERPA